MLNDFLLNESIFDKGIFKCLFLAGGQCSGKSTVITKITSGQIAPRVVNIDKFIEYFSTDGKVIYDTPLHDRAKVLSNEQLYLYTSSLLPLIIDGTGADPQSTIHKMNILKDIGYDCGMVMVNVSKETALRRLEKRNAEGGRQVALDSFNKRHAGVEKAKSHYRSAFDFYLELNNDDGMLTDEVVQQAFKKSLSFFTSPVKNDIGSAIIDRMRAQNIKYLIPDIYSESQLKSMCQRFN